MSDWMTGACRPGPSRSKIVLIYLACLHEAGILIDNSGSQIMVDCSGVPAALREGRRQRICFATMCKGAACAAI